MKSARMFSILNLLVNHQKLTAQELAEIPIVTANGTATLEFAKEIMNHLKVYSEEKLQKWYDFYKNGFYEE
ncbi:hypothetical protein [Lysinibacillus xylanilyticus]|uniref:hypothetical protein n=1 Tax=Lysinibacillus xylanilyticus TaxID=582475 RepID=UPI003D08E590